ncbi:MAG TPA: outer membrane protein assembly factor BamD [Coxiellaceae bacterium]|nr:outer membrane protein assembly factor BamD [Coxiellaceae bacterium]
MRKLLLLSVCSLTAILSGCSDNALHDSFSQYKNQTAAQLYQSSMVDLQKGHDDSAVERLEALNALYPFGAYAEPGLINLTYAYYKNDDDEEALATADRYLRLYPQGQYADYAYYMRGVISFLEGFTWLQKKADINPAPMDLTSLNTAYLSFNELVHAFPNSAYQQDSLARMHYIRNLFAEKELGIAKFYYERKAYVAAINRASNVLVHYNRTPSIIPALKIMIGSYNALGMTEKANASKQMLQASFPNIT